MINQIGLHAVVAGEQVAEELPGELRLAAEQVLHGNLVDANDRAGFQRVSGEAAKRPARQGSFTKKAGSRKVSYDGFLAVHGYDGELDLAAMDVENRIGGVAFRKDGLTGQVFTPRFSGQIPVHRTLKVECGLLLRQSGSLVRYQLQFMTGGRRQRIRTAQRNPGRRIRQSSDASSHDRYLSILQGECKGMNYRHPLPRVYNQGTE